jgi:ATP-dependent DNA helicase PIF1
MSNISIVEKKWIENFSKSPLVDEQTGLFKKDFAHVLFYERPEESLYPSDFPNDFYSFYRNHTSRDILSVLNACCVYLNFVGISIEYQKAVEFIRNTPPEFPKFVEKCYYILKSLAHNQTIEVSNPFKDTFREIDYLLRIECGELQLNIFDEPLHLRTCTAGLLISPRGTKRTLL